MAARDTHPRILYDLAAVPNADFDTGADAASPPSGWTISTLLSGDAIEIDTGVYFDRGDKASVKSLRVKNAAAPAGDLFVAADSIPSPTGALWYPPAGTKIAWTGVYWADGPTGTTQFQLQEKDSAGTNVAIVQVSKTATDGLWKAFSVEHAVLGTGNHFHLAINAFTPGVDWRYDAFALGRRLDFNGRRIRSLAPEFMPGQQIARGGGAAAPKQLLRPGMKVRANFGRIGEAVAIDPEVRAWLALALAGDVFAFWSDRSDHRLAAYAFRECVLTQPPELPYVAGPLGYDLEVEFMTPRESRR